MMDDLGCMIMLFLFNIKFSFTAMIYVVPQWIDGKNIPPDEQYSSFLSWDKLKKLCGAGWEIGSHSYDHRDLTRLSVEEINNNLVLAEQVLFNKLNVMVAHFC